MIVTITIKCRAEAVPTPPTLADEYREFREVIEDTVRRGGFGRAVNVRWLIDTGREVKVA